MSQTYCECGGKSALECANCARDYCTKCMNDSMDRCSNCRQYICGYECTLTHGEPLGPNECCLCGAVCCDYCLVHETNHETDGDCKFCTLCTLKCQCSIVLCEACHNNGICCKCGAKIVKPKILLHK